jgi:hypothetical protein
VFKYSSGVRKYNVAILFISSVFPRRDKLDDAGGSVDLDDVTSHKHIHDVAIRELHEESAGLIDLRTNVDQLNDSIYIDFPSFKREVHANVKHNGMKTICYFPMLTSGLSRLEFEHNYKIIITSGKLTPFAENTKMVFIDVDKKIIRSGENLQLIDIDGKSHNVGDKLKYLINNIIGKYSSLNANGVKVKISPRTAGGAGAAAGAGAPMFYTFENCYDYPFQCVFNDSLSNNILSDRYYDIKIEKYKGNEIKTHTVGTTKEEITYASIITYK